MKLKPQHALYPVVRCQVAEFFFGGRPNPFSPFRSRVLLETLVTKAEEHLMRDIIQSHRARGKDVCSTTVGSILSLWPSTAAARLLQEKPSTEQPPPGQ